MDTTRETHPSYGLVGFCRVKSSEGVNLFGSSIPHNELIELTIKQAVKERILNHDFVAGREHIVTVTLSQVQFAELVSTFNTGDGVCCTISRRSGREVEDCPADNPREKVQREFELHLKDTVEFSAKAQKEIAEILKKKSVTTADRQRINSILDKIVMDSGANTSYIQKQFQDIVDKTVVEAKGEMEAFFDRKIHSMGLDALRDEAMQVLRASEDAKLFEGGSSPPSLTSESSGVK